MTENESQKMIIDRREGFVVADAGPGTGKTHTVTARCMEILRDGLKGPKRRTAMLTFTRNAAAEMQERLIGKATVDYMTGIDEKPPAEKARLMDEYKRIVSSIRDMFVGTFDSFCLSIVKKSPGTVSRFFRFDEELTSSATTTENETLNRVFFRRFISEWLEDHGNEEEYGEFPAIIASDPLSVYSLIERLMCMGIIPMKSGGWFGSNLRDHSDDVGPAGEPLELRGDPELVETLLCEAIDGWNAKPSDSTRILAKDKCMNSAFADGLDRENPTYGDAANAAYDDRDALLKTVHDIYYEFIRKSVATDHLTFGLTACFAFIILYENQEVREGPASYDYLIVDEFQDTNTLQMMISMMVLKSPNLCVVGDWRQGIYGFRYVSVENITEFESRLRSLRSFLNDDGVKRVRYSISSEDIFRKQLSTSYRSSRAVIHTAYTALVTKATEKEDIDPEYRERIMSEEISPGSDELERETSVVKVLCADKGEEVNETVRRIIAFVKNKTPIFDSDKGEWRDARFGDIAVLCRKTESCRQIYRACRKHNIPAFLQGDMQIMNTAEGKLLLAWLKFVENGTDSRGIVPILAFMGYSANEIARMISNEGKLPPEIERAREVLRRKTRRLADFISFVYDFHGIDNDISQAISDVISTAHKGSLMTISGVVSMMEEDIRNRTSYPVDGHPESNAVIIQTVHKSKGLEYPYVIIPFLDARVFPSTANDRGLFAYSEVMGIRCANTLVTMANGDVVEDGSWKTAIVRKWMPRDYDEERRLFFVAISRAKQHVCFIAGKGGSSFFKNICCTAESEPGTGEIPVLDSDVFAAIDAPVLPPVHSVRPISLGVHAIMGVSEEKEFEGDSIVGKGMNYGTRVHRSAEMIANGTELAEKAFEEMPELVFIRKELDRIRECTQFNTEIECTLHLDVRGRAVVLNGNMDLMAVGKDSVLIYDWKTDASQKFRDEYRLQLSVYAACAKRYFPDKDVRAYIVWTNPEFEERERVDVLSESEIVERVIEALDHGKD